MKNLLAINLLLISGVLFLSCQKTTEVKPSIYGIWKGKFGIGANTVPNTDVIFDLKADGTIIAYNGADIPSATTKGTGTFQTSKDGLELSAQYMYPNNQLVYSVQMASTSEFKTLKGNWKFNESPGGKIELIKQ